MTLWTRLERKIVELGFYGLTAPSPVGKCYSWQFRYHQESEHERGRGQDLNNSDSDSDKSEHEPREGEGQKPDEHEQEVDFQDLVEDDNELDAQYGEALNLFNAVYTSNFPPQLLLGRIGLDTLIHRPMPHAR